jgi:hypothetical protein
MNDLLSEDTPISNIQSIFTHMCMSASDSQVLIGSLHVGLHVVCARRYLTAQL